MSTVLEALTPCVLPPTVSESCAARTASTDGERVYVGTTDGFVCGWRATQPWTLRVRVSSAGRAVEKIVVLRDYGAIAKGGWFLVAAAVALILRDPLLL